MKYIKDLFKKIKKEDEKPEELIIDPEFALVILFQLGYDQDFSLLEIARSLQNLNIKVRGLKKKTSVDEEIVIREIKNQLIENREKILEEMIGLRKEIQQED